MTALKKISDADLGFEWTRDLATIADRCGEHVAQALAQTYPGLRKYIPKEWSEEGPLGFLGPQDGPAVCALMGGDTIYITTHKRRRDNLGPVVKELDAAGLTTDEIVLQLGVSENWVRRLRKQVGSRSKARRKIDPRQIDWIDEN